MALRGWVGLAPPVALGARLSQLLCARQGGEPGPGLSPRHGWTLVPPWALASPSPLTAF